MAKKKMMEEIAMWLVLIGGLNWGLAVFDVNLVTLLLGFSALLVKIVYGLVGASALWLGIKKFM